MRILIGYDGSDGAKAAIDDLAHAALPQTCQATVLAVVEGRARAKSDNAASAPDIPTECPAIAEEGAAHVRRLFPSWTVTSDVCVGDVANELISRAEHDSVDLLVVGSRGYGQLKRLLFGSVTQRVLMHAPCSVRIGRGRPSPSAERRPPVLIVGADGSPDGATAVEAVAARDWPVGTRILVATFETGIEARMTNWAPNTIWGGDPITLDAPVAAERPALKIANEAAHLLKYRCPGVFVNTLVQPVNPKYGLIDAAENWDAQGADCIYVGATGVQGIARFLIGSVSTAVALSAPCSVEVVRRPRPAAKPST